MSSPSPANPARAAKRPATAEHAPARAAAKDEALTVDIVEPLPPRPFNPNRALTAFSMIKNIIATAYGSLARMKPHGALSVTR
ncbi:uncharacterized protein K452DRAFT_292317 [Aplosporella prunicola CBS 121167]|uniref:Uncharacterized protein n=1 Tax=Aplosporella prunicola CBS 121167 TaxID=1176127 RepID=A0A6A6B0H5_9PEZI|nr:uncharacterized protein K452DRAFT_292317 [Aplosporella prunicola CBS 121167]KAF2136537.1 hypothetical protein K452DRAFT_292317 [Aplosporella prunicola CBS 121167]